MPDLAEQQIIAQAQAGDQGALADLLQNHQHRLYNVVLRMVGQHDDAAELTQDAMLKIIQHIGGFDRRSAISTWMIRIAMNLAISHLRKLKLRRTVSLDSSAERSGEADDQSTPLRERLVDTREQQPEQCVQQDEMVRNLFKVLGGLEQEFRSVLVLRDIDQMDYQAIAEVLSVPVGTVKSRLFRARLALRQQMLNLEALSEKAAASDGANPGAPGVPVGPIAPGTIGRARLR